MKVCFYREDHPDTQQIAVKREGRGPWKQLNLLSVLQDKAILSTYLDSDGDVVLVLSDTPAEARKPKISRLVKTNG